MEGLSAIESGRELDVPWVESVLGLTHVLLYMGKFDYKENTGNLINELKKVDRKTPRKLRERSEMNAVVLSVLGATSTRR